ncbi:hypothetical protein ACN47E_001115 [Coniothyrium glycines]
MSQNYAYSVENWVHSTSLAQLDTTADLNHVDDAPPSSPDHFYKAAYTSTSTDHQVAPPLPVDMAATASRPRQSTTNRVRSPSRPTLRSASGPASSAAATRSPPHVANKVRALAERFERSPGSSPGSTASTLRSRSREPARLAAPNAVKRAPTSTTSTSTSTPASAARPSREAAYGSYRFNNLKPRERPQPAPASPRSARRTTGSRSSIDHQLSSTSTPTRKAVTSPRRSSTSSTRQPFFGEVVNGQDDLPGFGIPSLEGTLEDSSGADPSHHNQELLETSQLPSTSYNGETAPYLHTTPGSSSRQRSPPSRIPVATRRLSATSDSSSSTRSVKYTPTRSRNHSNRNSPTRMYRRPLGAGHVTNSRSLDHPTLPMLAYRGYHERGKSPSGSRAGPTVPAVVTASLPPLSPRLRNSRERQALQPSPNSQPSSHGDLDYFQIHDGVDALHEGEYASDTVRVDTPTNRESLSVQTTNLAIPSSHHPVSAATEFEESPVLGMPGGFVLTPPTVHQEPEQPLLQPTVYNAPAKQDTPASPDIDQSELGVRESIPIMLSEEGEASHSWEPLFEPLSEGLQALSFEPLPSTHDDHMSQPDSPSHIDDSPIDPFSNRGTLFPDDSASIAAYRPAGMLAIDHETYSVINSVLNLYHQSPVIHPELAYNSRDRVHHVSPVIAQHNDWESKEATETYLARVLSDANDADVGLSKQQADSISRKDLPHVESEPSMCDRSGTAIVYSPESRRSSRGSGGSTTTTIQEDASHSGHSGDSSQNPLQDSFMREWPDDDAAVNLTSIELPQLAWTNGGLGLSMQNALPHSPLDNPAPPRPAYSPPPPPPKPSIGQQIASAKHEHDPPAQLQLARPSHAHEPFEMHPARSRTPVIQTREKTLEDRYGTPQPVDVSADLPGEGAKGGCEPPDPAKQALIRRYRILEELLTTEHQFCIDMMIAHNIFEATAQNLMSEKEKKLLFSNCKELEKFSLSLFRSFKKAAKPIVNYEIPPPTGPWNHDSPDSKPANSSDPSLHLRRPSEDSENQFESCTLQNDHLTTVGQVFLDNREKMERLYTTYFLNQDNASAYIKKNQHNPDLASWVVACFEQVENMTQAWDLDSLLLKPCQRLLKYPLLLEGLVNASDPDHPDLANIRNAKKELLAINARINDAKARSDTFRAAASEGKKEKSRGKGLGKTFVKAFIPKVDKNKAYDEADRTFKDQEYKSREQKFGGHFFQLQIVIRDFEQYLDSVTEHYLQLNIVFLGFITVCEVAPSVYPEIESTWRKWAMAHFELQNKALEEHKAAVRSRVLKPINDLWEMWVSYQKTIEQRKKYLLYYVKHKQLIERGERVDADLEESAKKFSTINDTLKHELPLLYERTKGLMRTLMTLFMCLQKDWYKTCSKKILPLLESEPQHTTSLRYDLESYVERFHGDYKPMQDLANRLGIVNRNLLIDISNMTSPVPTIASDGGGSSRNSSSRRTESMGSEASILDSRNRNSGGYGPRSHPRAREDPPRSSPAGPAYPSLYPVNPSGRIGPGPTSLREARALSPVSDYSDATIVHERRNTGPSRNQNYLGLDGVVDFDDRSPFGTSSFDFPPHLGASFLSPTSQPMQHSLSAPITQTASLPGSTRTSGIFNSALPMAESPLPGSAEDLPSTPADTDEPEVLFLAASLFEFNIAHDRREGGIPYLVYVPGEIFDVIGMKGELWLARNQDDSTKTVGWIWEKHFARILPEDA